MFILEQLHFHWDAEHTIDGVRDALELHFVHYDKKYGNVSNASHYQNGICVVAVLFKVFWEEKIFHLIFHHLDVNISSFSMVFSLQMMTIAIYITS